jgi:short-subunit dehydrogenase
MSPDSNHKRALVTGASSGFGAAFARRLARQGYDLVLVARRQDRLEELARDLSEAHDIGAEVIVADLAADEGVAAVEERLATGDIDLLVNSAGFGTNGAFVDLPLEREVQEIDLNVRALTRLTRAALGPMTKRGSGAIVNIASTAAFQPVPYMATYAATKAYVLSFSEAVHDEVRDRGVTVTALCPGPVKTEFQQVAGVDAERVPGMVWIDPERVVDQALAAVRSRRASTVPGVFNSLGAVTVKFAPRFLSRRIASAWFKRTYAG